MFQLFLQSATITSEDWDKVYPQIVEVAEAFPLRLLRIESYGGYERNQQDKAHLDLIAQRGQPDEHLSFYGDWMSWTSGNSIRFYENWSKHCELALEPVKSDPGKPIIWRHPLRFKDDGSLLAANGESTKNYYVDTNGALYRFALIAIGMLLENRLPGRAFSVAQEEPAHNIERVLEWLEGHFGETFEMPLYFDKKRLLDTLKPHYDDPKHVAERLEQLYRKQFKRNMTFALEHIGYEPTFRLYAEVLSDCWFGTFGFSDVLSPWIAVTQDLESALNLIAESKRLRLERGDTKQAAKYDLKEILKSWLDDYILWPPSQREELRRFYTNEEALETGDEDLWGTLLRITGFRIDICPIVASKDELFEAFMFHEPSKGHVFRKTIDDWLSKNGDAFERLLEKLQTMEESPSSASDETDDDNDDETAVLEQYPLLERPFIEAVLQVNPAYFQLDAEIEALSQVVRKLMAEDAHQSMVAQIRAEPNELKKSQILYQLKEKRMVVTAGADFEQWLEEEEDPEALFFLRMILSLKIYNRGRAYARYRILHDRTLWHLR